MVLTAVMNQHWSIYRSGVNSVEISSVCLDMSRQTLEISALFTPIY